MPGFFQHWIHTNVEFLERVIERAKHLFPGSPEYGVILFHDKEHTSMGQITVDDNNQTLSASVTFLDAGGNQTTPDDTPQWSSTDENVATVEATADGMGATVTVGSPGAAVIEVRTTDTDGDEHVFQGTVTVQPGDVEVGEITFTESGGGVAEPPVTEPPAEEQPTA